VVSVTSAAAKLGGAALWKKNGWRVRLALPTNSRNMGQITKKGSSGTSKTSEGRVYIDPLSEGGGGIIYRGGQKKGFHKTPMRT